jgi:hypothetical protein
MALIAVLFKYREDLAREDVYASAFRLFCSRAGAEREGEEEGGAVEGDHSQSRRVSPILSPPLLGSLYSFLARRVLCPRMGSTYGSPRLSSLLPDKPLGPWIDPQAKINPSSRPVR